MTPREAIAAAYRCAQNGDAVGAGEICETILTSMPAHALALHLLGMLADRRGEAARAIDYLERASAAADAPAFVQGDLAELYQRAGQLADAEAAARRAVASDDADAAAWHRLGLVQIALGQLDASRRSLERAVALAPSSVSARNNLGIVLQRIGETERACEQYRHAVSLDPDNAASTGNLASALNELGHYEEALASARRAMALAPDLPGSYVFAAVAESNLGRHGEALQHLDRAAALAPASIPVLIARADALRLVDRAQEGLACCEAAVAIDPSNGEAHNAHGLLLDWLGRDQEALAAFDRAIASMADPAVALANKAAVLAQVGERERAIALLDEALARDPRLAFAWYNRADAKTFAEGDQDIAAMERLLRMGEPQRRFSARHADNKNLLLHFALAKAYIDIGDGARAFAQLNEGNRIKRATIAYDAAATSTSMASLAQSFSAELLACFAGAGNDAELPIFVIGMPRSGTTLIEQVLASHPQVEGAGELHHLERLARELEQELAGAALAAALRPDQIAGLGRRYLDLVRPSSSSIARVVDKMPSNFLRAGLIHLVLPRARIVHCRRDPMDTCFSCYSKLFTRGQEFTYDMAELGRYYRCYERLMAHWRIVLPAERFLEIDYESVVTDFDAQIRRLVAFCGLPWDDACVRFYETKRIIRTASKNQVRQPLYRSSIGRWRRFEAELRPLRNALGERGGDAASV